MARGYEITVFTSNAWDPESYHKRSKERLDYGSEIHDGLTIHRFEIRTIPLQFKVLRAISLLPGDRIKLLFGSPYVLLPGYLREMFFTRPRFDLIIAGVLPYSHLLFPAAWLAEHYKIPWTCIPFIHTGIDGVAPLPGYLTRSQIRLMDRADAILTATNAENQVLEARGIDPQKVHSVGIGIDPDEIIGGDANRFRSEFAIHSPIILQISSQSRDKGSIDLIEAMKILWAWGSAATLVLIGQPMDHFSEYLSQQTPDVLERIRCLGFVDELTKKDALAACDIFVMASSTESFGIVYLEAWLYGKPVIGARAGGVPWLLTHNRDALLVNFGQPADLADSVRRLLSEDKLRVTLGENGRAKALKDYTWDNVFTRVVNVIDPLLDASSSV